MKKMTLCSIIVIFTFLIAGFGAASAEGLCAEGPRG